MTSSISLGVDKVEVVTNDKATYGIVTLTDKRKLKVEVLGGDEQMVKMNMSQISAMAIEILIEQNILQENAVGRFLSAEIDQQQTTAVYEKDTESHEHFNSSEKVNRLFNLILMASETPEQRREREHQKRIDEDRQKEIVRASVRHAELESDRRKEELASEQRGNELDDLMHDLSTEMDKREEEEKRLRAARIKEEEIAAAQQPPVSTQQRLKVELLNEDGSAIEIPTTQPQAKPKSFFSGWMPSLPSLSSLTSYLEI
jgi:hypothetical protein